MAVYTSDNIRNILVAGHGTTGKTSLVNCLVYTTGAVDRLGQVDAGQSVTDYTDEEIEHHRSFYTGIAWAEWQKTKVNILDTPGYAAFIYEARGAMRVADAALIVLDATTGIEVMTEKVWAYARDNAVPCLFVLNKMDRERADFDKVYNQLKDVFGRAVVPLQLPLGKEDQFTGLVDILDRKAWRYDDDSGKGHPTEVPTALHDKVEACREILLELIAENDEALMETYFETGDLPPEILVQGLKDAFQRRQIFPVVVFSAAKNIGSRNLLNAVVKWFPSPLARGSVTVTAPDRDDDVDSVPVSDADPFIGFVFKTVSDPYTGRISVVRSFAGRLTPDTVLVNVNKDSEEKVGSLNLIMGKQLKTVPEVYTGDIFALTKLKETYTNDTLCAPDRRVKLPPTEYGKPVIFYALEPKSRADEDKLSSALGKVTEEDPMLRIERNPETKELIISGAGQLHIQVAIERMKNKFGVNVELKPPRIPYRETIRHRAEAQGKYKKQSGGRGQYGDCWIRLEPLPRGEDFVFEETIFGGAIPKQYIPAVEKGILEAREKGVLAGYRVVDFKVTLFDGSYHEVDSSDLAFKIAGSMAFKNALEKAGPVLLEPVMTVTVYCPEDNLGDVMGDLNGRRARILGIDREGTMQVVRAKVPLAEMLNYNPALTSLTGARGYFEMEHSHYDEVPAHIAEKIIAAARAGSDD